MTILTGCHTNQGANFTCAQTGCANCMEYLLEKNVGLIHACVRYAEIGGVPYMEAVEEGRIGLWRAILRYDPSRQVAFSTFAWRFIWGHIWRYTVEFSQKGEALKEEPYQACLAQLAEEAWRQAQIAGALREALELLPERRRDILQHIYGLGDQPPQSMAEIGRQMGVTRERIRQLRNDALLLLRLPALSLQVRNLCEQDSRQAYRKARQLNEAWLRRQRGPR